ncbi:hypothetical protein MIND_01432600 [Mycena indigotica]|uniref:Uncharacterized protein n=1 Tax=Mycena indigotica TaxID=2126181 RepID=A0A8H6RWZ6_9AGAR|nr:uncharacterized protein MIND_01432600 [Mycena indigotica]KAF7288456.1 hypothetical protein MIND_01432600 [Mycena indigotica]
MSQIPQRPTLEQVPPWCKQIALAACSPTCSVPDFNRFLRVWTEASPTVRSTLLPVLLYVFDPARIPSPVALETGAAGYPLAMACTEDPNGIMMDLVQVVVPWYDFFSTFHASLDIPINDNVGTQISATQLRAELLHGFIRFMNSLHSRDPQSGPFQSWETRHEQFLFDTPMAASCYAGMDAVHLLPQNADRGHLSEIINSIDGSLKGLFTFLKAHLRVVRSILPLGNPATLIALFYPLGLFKMLHVLSAMTSEPESPPALINLASHTTADELYSCRLAGDLLPMLTILYGVQPPHPDVHHALWAETVRLMLEVVDIMMRTHPRVIRYALRQDLLRHVLPCVRLLPDDAILAAFSNIFSLLIPAALLHRSVLPALAISIEVLEAETAQKPLFQLIKTSTLGPMWTKMTGLVGDHHKIFLRCEMPAEVNQFYGHDHYLPPMFGLPLLLNVWTWSMRDPESHAKLLQDNPDLDVWRDRARRSRGRLLLYVISVSIGPERTMAILIPLRMNMSFLGDMAARLTRRLTRREGGMAAELLQIQQAFIDSADRWPKKLLDIFQY